MNWWETLRSGFEAIAGHRLRSGLTVLGIMIGIAAVVLTVGLGEGATASVNSEISSLGTNLLIVSPGSSTSGLIRKGLGSDTTLTYANAVALEDKVDCPNIIGVAPQVSTIGSLVSGNDNWATSVYGSTPSWLSVRGRSMAEGSFFTQAELEADDNVVVLGQTTAEELGLFNPIGDVVNINSEPFTVIGVLNLEGSSSSSANEDDLAIVPITTAQEVLTGLHFGQQHILASQLQFYARRRLRRGQ